jgi:hypothetical protein
MIGSKEIRRKLLGFATRCVVRPFERKVPASKRVAILVPLSNRPTLTDEEQISMRQMLHHLGNYDIYLIAPEGLDIGWKGCQTKWFPKKFFGSAAAHGKLLMHRFFYREFLDYEFVFFHHLDSLAFSDQLEEWCSAGIDYIGPPWIPCDDSPWVDRPRVGNGGFTLLRVESAIKSITNLYLAEPSSYWFSRFTSYSPKWVVKLLAKFNELVPNIWVVRRLLQEWHEMENPAPHNRNNDIFWSDQAVSYFPDFKVASLEEGLRFAFEVAPRKCLEMNGGKMPFGCHAWAQWDREFWEPFIVPATGESLG